MKMAGPNIMNITISEIVIDASELEKPVYIATLMTIKHAEGYILSYCAVIVPIYRVRNG